MNTRRTCIIGLDGATFDLIDPLVRAGYLPTFQFLMQNGAHAALNAFPDMNSAAAWSSLVTGYNAGAHGIFHFDANWYRLSQKGIKPRPTIGADRKRDPFWRVLGAAGQRVGVVNVPISYPADALNGFMLAGMDAPGTHSQGFCYPPDLYTELRAQGIAYEIDTLNLARHAQERPYELPQEIKRLTNARVQALEYLMQHKAWDVLMGVFVATDRVQHFFWTDETVPPDAPPWNALRELYQQLDAFLARALQWIGPEANLLIVSDHGFGRKRNALHALNDLFAQWGLLDASSSARDVQGTFLAQLLKHGRRLVPASMQYPLTRLFPALHLRALTASGFAAIDWSHTQVFADPDGWGVYINLQGREPEGIVPQSEYLSLRQRVRERLLDLRDSTTHQRVLRAVHEREKIFHGPFVEHAPDLMLEWNFETVGDSLAYADAEKLVLVHQTRRAASDEKWQATHRPDGILMAYGPDIQKTARLTNVSLYDIAPTILHLQGLPLPTDMDGRVPLAIYTPAFANAHPLVYVEPSALAASNASAPDLTDMHLVEERLRALGYLEEN